MHPLTTTWWRLFINRTDGTLRQQGNGWHFDPMPLERCEINVALYGRQSLGVYATDEAGLSRWVCLDADDEHGADALLRLAGTINPRSTLFERSRRGAHLWWFCPPTSWMTARSVGLALAASIDLACEVFPKGEGRTGVRLPLTPHPRTGETYPVLDPTTGEIRSIADLRRLKAERLPQLAVTPVIAAERREWVDGPERFGALVREIERFTSLRQYGPERAIGRCPFHDDRQPSLSVLGGFWRCWAGCGEGGIGAFRAHVDKKGW